MTEFRVVLVTCPNSDCALSLARALVEEKLAACANMIDGLRSIYMWKGQVCDEAEVLLIIKTRQGRLEALMERVRALHPYEVPEIIALPVAAGSEAYLRWLADETGA